MARILFHSVVLFLWLVCFGAAKGLFLTLQPGITPGGAEGTDGVPEGEP